MVSRTVSIWVVAWVSNMFLLFSDVFGGIYTFTIFILWLFGSIIFVCKPYLFPDDVSIYSGFCT